MLKLKEAESFLKKLKVTNPIRLAEIIEEKTIVFKKAKKNHLVEKYKTRTNILYQNIGAPFRIQKFEKKLEEISNS